MREFRETLYREYGQRFAAEEILLEQGTGQQHLVIFRNALLGKVMMLDGVVQTTERDEFVYHEMMVHVPMLAHGEARRVLIVGGGDGGILREVTRHPGLQTVTMVEIDRAVIEMSREYFPAHSAGAFDDPRLELVIGDGADFVRRSDQQWDVIIVDGTDPIGPGEVLFSETFYGACLRRLAAGGIMVTQNGVPFFQQEELRNSARLFEALFADWHFYTVAVPTYVGGIMTLGWASNDSSARQVDIATLRDRFRAADLSTRYYTPELHRAAFELPAYLLEVISKNR